MSTAVFLLGILLIVLLAINFRGLRTAIPGLRSGNIGKAALSWLGVILVWFALMGATANPSQPPESGSTAPVPTTVAAASFTPTALPPTPTASLPGAVATTTATSTPAGAGTPSPVTTVSAPVLSPTPQPSMQALEVHFIDVGQGDAILIVAPDDKAALIDGGEAGSGALQYLQGKGITKLDLVVATHPHADHIGGLPEVLKAIPVAKVVTNGEEHTTATYERFLDAIADAKAEYVEVKRGTALQLGSLTLDVLHPAGLGDNMNSNSVVLRLVHGQVAFLFAGDAESDAEVAIRSSGQALNAAVLKIGHHASRSSSSPQFLAAVKPQVAIYSAGAGNSYGHPHQETLANLANIGAEVYGTDVNGTVIVTSDGNGYSVSTSKTGDPRAPPQAAANEAAPTMAAAATPPIATATAVPQPSPTPAQSGGYRFVVSVQARTKYYCETDPAWKELSQANLRWYDSEEALKADYPNLTLNKPCK